MKPIALYILNDVDFIYGQLEREELAQLVEVVAPPQTAHSVRQNPDLLAEIELILSGWGAPVLVFRGLNS